MATSSRGPSSSQTASTLPETATTVMTYYAVRKTNTPAIKNAPLESLYEGNGYFSNYQLAFLVIVVPWLVKRMLPLVNRGGFKTYIFVLLLTGGPVTVGYWALMSRFGPRKNEKIQLPGRQIEEYITIHDPELKAKYHGKEKIPMQEFHDAYFDSKIDFNGAFPFLTRHSVAQLTELFDAFRRCP